MNFRVAAAATRAAPWDASDVDGGGAAALEGSAATTAIGVAAASGGGSVGGGGDVSRSCAPNGGGGVVNRGAAVNGGAAVNAGAAVNGGAAASGVCAASGAAPNGGVRALPTVTRLQILHFNDVYQVEERRQEPVGGAARFATLLRRLRAAFSTSPPSDHDDPDASRATLTLFSGDAFSPSVLSTAHGGANMAAVLAHLRVDAGTLGNHDFDFGVPALRRLLDAAGGHTRWVLTNGVLPGDGDGNGDGNDGVHDGDDGGGDCVSGADGCCSTRRRRGRRRVVRSALLDASPGLRVGILGLMEAEWLDALIAVDVAALCYTDFVAAATAGAAALRAAGAHVVLALTHMRLPNDERLADEATGVDLILGGHDHSIVYTPARRGMAVRGGGAVKGDTAAATCRNGATRPRPAIVKSGTDFRHLSALVLAIDRSTAPATVTVEAPPTIHAVTRTVPPDAAVEAIIRHYVATAALGGTPNGVAHGGGGSVLAYLSTPADASSATLRTSASAVGSLIADIVAATAPGGGADVALINAGTLRSDTVHPAGPFTAADLDALLPYPDQRVAFPVTGAELLDALEVGVGALPAAEGRYPLVSGVCFAYDPRRPPGGRVDAASVWVRCRRGGGLRVRHGDDAGGDRDGGGGGCCGGGERGETPFVTDARGSWAPLNPAATYVVATKTFLTTGADGYRGLAVAHRRAVDAGWPAAVAGDSPPLAASVAAFFAATTAEAAARVAGDGGEDGTGGKGACVAALVDEVLRRGAAAAVAAVAEPMGGRSVATGGGGGGGSDGGGGGGGGDKGGGGGNGGGGGDNGGAKTFCLSPVRSAVGAPLPWLGLVNDGRVVDVAAAAATAGNP